ncbi:cinnamoyl-CoA reductase 2-like [Tripterygium wilfordii]|uniref:cinnamoyl-CoA reductase 2-like n=1 Tax=Tripterygium wilfordii TaxID=458696 RepID=UPI0018F810D9|nr:cinnamoyl-CoA reductase 2-like [Tripterygium wilfordii]
MVEREKVCVTGAGGYLGSWVVKFLLSKGYIVHGTVRDPEDDKNTHLKKLEHAEENLKLFKADLLDYDGLCIAIAGCSGVFHIACPVPLPSLISALNYKINLIEPSVKGTLNVLDASVKAKVNKVVYASSIGAVVVNPNLSKGQVMDENCWSDIEFCKSIEVCYIKCKLQQWYCVAKTLAEQEAWEYAKRSELKILTVCPSIIIGPRLQPTMNSSSLYLLRILKDGSESAENRHRALVDVRDTAESLLMLYEKPEAEGRYICSSHEIREQDLVEKLKNMYPYYNYPKSFSEGEGVSLNSEKLQNLGWKYRPLEDTLVDAVKDYEESGALAKVELAQTS